MDQSLWLITIEIVCSAILKIKYLIKFPYSDVSLFMTCFVDNNKGILYVHVSSVSTLEAKKQLVRASNYLSPRKMEFPSLFSLFFLYHFFFFGTLLN